MSSATLQNHEAVLLDAALYIQLHLTQKLSLETLAARGGFSPYYFHRLFREFAGEPVREYVRRLRLERAAYRLKISQDTVLEIALESGFHSHETFTRAFVRQFGAPPSQFRADFQHQARDLSARAEIPVRASIRPVDSHLNQTAGQTALNFAREQIVDTTVRMERVRAFEVAFVRHVGPYEGISEAGAPLTALWAELLHWGSDQDAIAAQPLLLGIPQDDPTLTPPDKQRFDVCVQVHKRCQPVGSIGIQTINSGTYAVGRHYGPFATLSETYLRVYQHCAHQTRWQIRTTPCLEVYGSSWINNDLQIDFTDIYMPVMPVDTLEGEQT